MELKVITLDGKAAGSVPCPTRSSGLSRAPTFSTAACCGSSPSAVPAPTRSRTAPRSIAPARRCIVRRAPAAPATVPPRCNLFRGGGRAFGPVVRSHAIGLPKKVRALALGMRSRPRPRTAASSCSTRRAWRTARPKRWQRISRSSGLTNALIIDGAEIEANFRQAARNIPNIDVLPVQGINVYDILRRHTGADQGRGRCAGGAIQMTTSDPRHYDVILSPVITEKATTASEHNQVMFKVATQRDQAADQGGGREAVRRQGEERQHPDPQGQGEGVPRPPRAPNRRQARHRDPRRGSLHRRDHGSLRSGDDGT